MAIGQTELNQFPILHQMHWDCQQWKSTLHFIDDGIIFMEGLLNTYTFLPNTPSLFEKIQDYNTQMKNLKKIKAEVRSSLSKHENISGGLMEVYDCKCDGQLFQKHDILKAQVADCVERFHTLRSEIYCYAANILKNRRRRE